MAFVDRFIVYVNMLKLVCNKIDDIKHPRKVFAVFLAIWFVVNLLQAIFTELAHDEAYYWLFSRNLAWGYFDHPPMIALLIKTGYSLFDNELGVRLLPLILGVGTLYLIYLLIEDSFTRISTVIILLSSIVILQSHVGGFIAIPDVPVIFFSALFFYLYKLYLKKDSAYLAILIAVSATAMLYSKYHGVLVLFFTLISNFSLLKRKTFYLIPVLTVIGMLPHLFWQIEAGFPTFEYHLVSRSQEYTILHTLNYLLGQFLISGPFIGIILFVNAIKQKEDGPDYFMRAMKFNFYGFFGFFFLMSFKGHVEAHWTAIGFIALIVVSLKNIEYSTKSILWLRRLFIPTLVGFLFIRISLLYQIVPPKYNLGAEFHGWDTWARELKRFANGRRVVFYGTFQRPSKYSFYTKGEFAHTLNQIWYRKNQFDLWNYTDSLQGKDVIIYRTGYTKDSITVNSEKYFYRIIDDYRSYENIPVLHDNKEVYCNKSDSLIIDLKLVNTRIDTIDLTAKEHSSPRFCLVFYNSVSRFGPMNMLSYVDGVVAPSDTLSRTVKYRAPEKSGDYICYLSIVNNNLWPGFNSKPFKLKVK